MSEELKLQLALLNVKYQITQINLSGINWYKFFISASNNRVLFHCCKRVIELNLGAPNLVKKLIENKILVKGQEYISKTKRTLNYLSENLRDYPFLICKTARPIDYITVDVDVLFRKSNYKQALRHLEKLGGKYIDCEKKNQGDIIINNMLRIDTHENFHWQKSDFISTKQLWNNTQTKEVFSVKCLIPNLENEVILNLLNLIYERHYIPLSDYYFIKHYKNQIDWGVVFQTAKNCKWEKALTIVSNKFNQIHYFLFRELLIDIGKYKKNYKFKKIEKLRVPFIFTYLDGLSVFGERLAKCHYIRWYEFLYFIFAKTRFHLIHHRKVPIYGHWYNLDNIQQLS